MHLPAPIPILYITHQPHIDKILCKILVSQMGFRSRVHRSVLDKGLKIRKDPNVPSSCAYAISKY